jgi:plasmid replication initiation protein
MEIISLNFDNITPESLNGAMVVKHNDLIEAKYQLPNLQEQRIIFMLLGQIKPSDDDFKYYRITVSDFSEIMGLKGKDIYAELDRATKALVSRTISIRRDEKSFLHMNWLSSAEYKSGSGYVELAFDPKLKPYLLQLKNHFTQYKIDAVLHFKSIYSIRLYELLKKEMYKEKNSQFSVYFEYENLREYFGIGKKEYVLFKDFRVKTIEPATREISDKTDLFINDVKYGKTGRKITNITFFVGVRTEQETKLRQDNLRIEDIKPVKESDNHTVIDSLVSLGISVEIAKRFKNKYGVKHIERNIAYTLAKKQAGLVKDIPAYLNKAIENDYGGAWDIEKKKTEEKKKELIEAEKKKQLEAEKKEKEAKERSKKIIESFNAFPSGMQDIIKRDFVVKIKEGNIFTYGEWIKAERAGKNPIESAIIRGMFIAFLVEQKICIM